MLIILVKENTRQKPSSTLFLLRPGSRTFFSKELINFPRRQKRDQANAELIEGPGNCSRMLLRSAETTETSELQGLTEDAVYTTMRFSRPFRSCDPHDQDITVKERGGRSIWSQAAFPPGR